MAVTRRYYVGILSVCQRLTEMGAIVSKVLSGLRKGFETGVNWDQKLTAARISV